MKAESEELLSSFVDGEDVEPDALASALAEPGAAEILVHYARVHRAVRTGDAVPSDAFYHKMRELGVTTATTPTHRGIRLPSPPARPPELEQRRKLQRRREAHSRWLRPLAAAAMILLSVAAGIWIGSSMLPSRVVSMPVAVRTPGTSPAAPVPVANTGSQFRIIMPADCPAVGPPPPSRVVQFVPRDAAAPGPSAGGERP